MKARFYIFCILLFPSLYIYAQIEDRRDSITINWENKLPDEYKNAELESNREREHVKRVSIEEQKKREEFVRSLNYSVPPLYVGPKDEGEKLGRILPDTYDYGFYQSIPLNDNTSLHTVSSQNTYLTIGASREISASLAHSLADWLTVSGGVYGAKYNLGGYHFNDFGVNASFRFKLHDRIYLRAHGLYSLNSFDSRRNFSPAMAGMFPQTYYGGGVEFKMTEKFGVEGGMVRELNPMNGKWTNRPYIMPIFYSR